MIQRRRRLTVSLYLANDLLATAAAFFLAWALRFESSVITSVLPTGTDYPAFQPYLNLLPVILITWPVAFYFHGLYQTRRSKSRVDEVLTVVLAVVLASLLLSVFTAWYRPAGTIRPNGTVVDFDYSRSFLALFSLADVFLVSAGRLVIRAWLRRARRLGHNLQRILVVGAGAVGQEITEKLLAHQELGFEVAGFLDDDPEKAGRSLLGVPVLGTVAQIRKVLRERRIDQVFIALPLEAHRKMKRVFQAVAQECVEVKMVPDVIQYAFLKASLEDVDGTPVINLSEVPLQGWYSMVKRGMDIAIAASALLVLLPLFPLVALAIWLEDRGSIFYRQERMGLDGRSFLILKFRSMRVNAESSTGPVWAIKNDPRRTLVGGFLRRWSLDELPQLWNVLRGDMSIVGPRPERPAFVHEFKRQIPQYMLRHRVKAGITGWAQVHGWRGNTSIRKRLQYDLYYIENWTLLLDFKILWMTLRGGLRHHNAY